MRWQLLGFVSAVGVWGAGGGGGVCGSLLPASFPRGLGSENLHGSGVHRSAAPLISFFIKRARGKGNCIGSAKWSFEERHLLMLPSRGTPLGEGKGGLRWMRGAHGERGSLLLSSNRVHAVAFTPESSHCHRVCGSPGLRGLWFCTKPGSDPTPYASSCSGRPKASQPRQQGPRRPQ